MHNLALMLEREFLLGLMNTVELHHALGRLCKLSYYIFDPCFHSNNNECPVEWGSILKYLLSDKVLQQCTVTPELVVLIYEFHWKD